jgi:hypothetical protein
MDGKIATLAGAAALAAVPALAGATPPASEPAVPVAATYAELLNPIPNASERLQRADAQAEARPELIEAQYVAHHHHHHHHHSYSRSWYRSHGYYWYGGRWTMRPRHHHHHHNHNDYHNHY